MSSTAQAAIQTQIVSATDVPVAALERFYEKMYPHRDDFLKRNWRWLYRVGHYKQIPSPPVILHNDEVIGHAGLIPVTLQRGDEQRTAIWFVDFGVLPEYQRHGLGIRLTKEWMSLCPLQITFCNEKSIGIFLKYGWEARFHTLSFSLLLRPEHHPKLRESKYRIPAQLAGAATRAIWQARTLAKGELFAAAAGQHQLDQLKAEENHSALSVPRTEEFLRWRIADHPLANQHFILTDSKVSAIVRVLKSESYRRLHVLSLHGAWREANPLSSFFGRLVKWAMSEEIDRIWFIASEPAVIKVAKWWLPVYTRARFACHANADEGWKFLSGTDHLWECLDSDFDLAML
ncbi:MAG: GNAT family N-acetyltransferase [Acidobacteriota bacterium]